MTTPPTETLPAGRVLFAFDAPTLDWDASSWTRIDDLDGVRVASYTIDRGRQVELDRTDAGRATIEIFDRDGVLDPTNAAGPYFGMIEPLLQVGLRRWNPIAEEWQTRFRGFIEDLDYAFDPSQQVNRLTITLLDIFNVLASIEMMLGEFGITPPPDADDVIYFPIQDMKPRILAVLEDAGIPEDWYVVFSGNVEVWDTRYSPLESAMTAIQEAADADFPGVSNVYTDRFGRLAVHGRLAKFDVSGVLAGASPGAWPWHSWHAGDSAAVAAAPSTTAHLREFGFNRGLSKVINSAAAWPQRPPGEPEITAAEMTGQLVQDASSIALRGIRSWSAQTLITKHGYIDGTTDLEETRRFADYYVANYSAPQNRTTGIGFRSIPIAAPGAGRTWRLLCEVDIADELLVTVESPGGGGFTSEAFFVEGVHETARPANPEMDDVTLQLDVSPQALFANDPWSGA